MNLKNKLLRCEKGQSIVLLPFIFVVLLGFSALVIDLGMLYVEKFELQTAVDAAALAGGQELPTNPGKAITEANKYAAKNGESGDEVIATVTNENLGLKVSAKRHVTLYFARIFGVNTSDVTANAAVTLSPPTSVSDVIPVGVEKQSFQYGQMYTLKVGGGDGLTGNYGPLALGGAGANVYEDNLKYGYSEKLIVGQSVNTETGNMVGPTNQGIDYRIDQDPAATFTTVQEESPRIVTLPIMESMNVNGNSTVEISGFAVFFLEDVHQGVITGRFIQMVVGDSTSGSGASYGAYHVRLTQ